MRSRSRRSVPILLASAALLWAALACDLPPVLVEYLRAPAAPVNSPLEREAGPGPLPAASMTFTATVAAARGSDARPSATWTAILPPTATFTPLPPPTFTPTTPAPAPPPVLPTATDPPSTAGYSSFVIALINGERASQGLPALSVDGTLMSNAQIWSDYMATSNVFYHSGQNVGENIAAGQDSPGAVMSAWIGSPGHYANILDPSYTRIGAGSSYSSSSTYGHYWTVQFLP